MSEVALTSSITPHAASRLPGVPRPWRSDGWGTNRAPGAPDPNSAEAKRAVQLTELRDVIDRTLGSVFYGPLLRAARNSSFKGTLGHGGQGEEMFQNQLDQVLAERAGRATATDLGDVLFNRYAGAVKARGITKVHDAN